MGPPRATKPSQQTTDTARIIRAHAGSGDDRGSASRVEVEARIGSCVGDAWFANVG